VFCERFKVCVKGLTTARDVSEFKEQSAVKRAFWVCVRVRQTTRRRVLAEASFKRGVRERKKWRAKGAAEKALLI
jgi:hypothetical protein